MPLRLGIPKTDPTPIFEHFNANFGNKILVAAATHLDVFSRLAAGPKDREELRAELGLADRPMHVVVTSLKAFDLLSEDRDGRLDLSELAREHLIPGGEFDVTDYLVLAENAEHVVELVKCLRADRPTNHGGQGTAYIAGEGERSVMKTKDGDWWTERLAGRAKNTGTILAEAAPLDGARHILDIGGGTGVFSIAYLLENPEQRATILELEGVADTARRYAERYGVSDRVSYVIKSMFEYEYPKGHYDAILLSNLLHDWGTEKCRWLLKRCFDALPSGGRLLVHDVLLDDDREDPVHVANYSVVLFFLTEGRVYSAAEYNAWLREAGFVPSPPKKTLVHCSVISAVKP
jgi:predicted O-methyltransferase YrrM